MNKAVVTIAMFLVMGLSAPVCAQQFYNPANGHYYEIVQSTSSWAEARDAAAGMTYGGMQGHLATITSSGENDFVVATWPSIWAELDREVWIGGTDQVSEGAFQWITSEPWSYENWGDGEPNDSEGEDCMVYKVTEPDGDLVTSWNDASCGSDFWSMVEYEPAAVPAMNNWGLVLFALLTGFVSISCLRRQRRSPA